MSDSMAKDPATLEIVLRAVDVTLLWLAGTVAYSMLFQTELLGAVIQYNLTLYLACFLAYLILPSMGVYRTWHLRQLETMFARLAFSWGVILSLAILANSNVFVTSALSRPWLVYWYALGVCFLVLARLAAFEVVRLLKARGFYYRRVVIVGYGHVGKELHRRVLENTWYGYEVQAVYLGTALPTAQLNQGKLHILPTLETLDEYVVANNIAEIWLTLPFSDSEHLSRLRNLLRNTLVDVRLIPDVENVEILSSKMVNLFGFPTIDLNQPQITGTYVIAKDLFDRTFAAIALLALSPLLIVLALAVKLTSPGPVVFRQRRLGLNGKIFYLYKFRSMRHDLIENVNQATANDPRITPLGSFLRRTSLDELPQFFNVLLGDMSIVGPRPHALQHNEIYTNKLEIYMLRHRVKPGITGWAQINGYRGETDTDEKMAMRVQYDLHYIKNWSFWLDVKIILLTGIRGWSGTNAY
jgi:putative colanic acid biosynthesis UDP-glucose lipid carrier transferase